jgi:hypothetical protein
MTTGRVKPLGAAPTRAAISVRAAIGRASIWDASIGISTISFLKPDIAAETHTLGALRDFVPIAILALSWRLDDGFVLERIARDGRRLENGSVLDDT